MAKKEEPFHDPFKKLKGTKFRSKSEPVKKEKKPAPPLPEPRETDLFSLAMKGVKPMENDLVEPPEPMDPKALASTIKEGIRRQEQEVIDILHGLVQGRERFDITVTGEYLEGYSIPIDPVTMKKLKSGEFTMQAHLDLHGYTRETAEQALVSFITDAHTMGFRMVLVIHGRGLKSDQGPVLKEHLVRWLTTGALSHLILAFCSARPCDGGTGALYVLLKRKPKKSKWKRPL